MASYLFSKLVNKTLTNSLFDEIDNSFFNIKLTASVKKSFHYVHDPCLLQLFIHKSTAINV